VALKGRLRPRTCAPQRRCMNIPPNSAVPNFSGLSYHQQMGLVATAMMNSPRYCAYPLACLSVWIEPAVLLHQIHFFTDLSGNPTGYMTWAFLTEDTARRVVHDPEVLLHISEWNEGTQLWIMDLLLLEGNIREIKRRAFALFPDHHEARSVRRTDDGLVRKLVLWRR
jgi:cytolysin-activating lysine-acyltransferase